MLKGPSCTSVSVNVRRRTRTIRDPLLTDLCLSTSAMSTSIIPPQNTFRELRAEDTLQLPNVCLLLVRSWTTLPTYILQYQPSDTKEPHKKLCLKFPRKQEVREKAKTEVRVEHALSQIRNRAWASIPVSYFLWCMPSVVAFTHRRLM